HDTQGQAIWFSRPNSTSPYAATHFSSTTDTLTATSGLYTFKRVNGANTTTITFHDFASATPGQLHELTDISGVTVSATYVSSKLDTLQRLIVADGVTVTDALEFAYLASGANAGRLDTVTLKREVNATWSPLR